MERRRRGGRLAVPQLGEGGQPERKRRTPAREQTPNRGPRELQADTEPAAWERALFRQLPLGPTANQRRPGGLEIPLPSSASSAHTAVAAVASTAHFLGDLNTGDLVARGGDCRFDLYVGLRPGFLLSEAEREGVRRAVCLQIRDLIPVEPLGFPVFVFSDRTAFIHVIPTQSRPPGCSVWPEVLLLEPKFIQHSGVLESPRPRGNSLPASWLAPSSYVITRLK
ncbi:hypothetical protein CapIbe_002630 [Capra ibex]